MTTKFTERFRLIAIIAAKDIVDAVKNKTILSIMIGVVLMMLTTQLLPFLLGLQDRHRLVIYPDRGTEIVDLLRDGDSFDLVVVSSYEQLSAFMGETSAVWLGVELPDDFEMGSAPGQPSTFVGYFSSMVSDSDVREAIEYFEIEFTQRVGSEVIITSEGNLIYPTVDAGGRPFMISMSLTILILIVSAFVVPYLMIEEKETHTLDVLLVSPASIGQVVTGKALAGLVYGFAGAAVMLVFNRHMVAHWGWITIAVVGGTFFASSLGLLMGSIFDNPQNLSLWLGFALAVLVVPVLLTPLIIETWPAILKSTIPWMPSVQLSKLISASFSETVPLSIAGPALTSIFLSALLLLAIVVRIVGRMDRA